MALDAQQVEQGITVAQAVVTFVSGLGLWEGAKGFWAYFRNRRQGRVDAEAAALKSAEDAGKAKVEQSRDARKDVIGEVWKTAEERQEEIDRLTTRDEEHRKDCHDRLDKAWAEIGELQKANAKL